MKDDSSKLEVIQVLRAVAALMVVAYHGVGYQPQRLQPGIEHVITMSCISGVDLFFMISGFIMVYATRNLRGGFDDAMVFLIKRMSRVWPAYVVATIIYIPLMVWMGHVVGHVDIMTKPSSILRSIFMIPTNFADGSPYFGGSVLHVGWTINYEAFFYCLFGIAILFGRGRLVVLATMAAVLLIGLPWLISTPSMDAYVKYGFNGPLSFYTSPLIWEFMVGALIGRIYLSPFRMPRMVANMMSLVSVAICVWFLVNELSPKMGFTGWAAPLALVLFSLTIGSKTMDIRWPRSLVWIGNISYSLYLVHPFVIHPAYQLLWDKRIPAVAMNNIWYMFVLAALSIALAAVSHHYLEQGLSEWVRVRAINYYRSLRYRQAAVEAA